MLQHAETTTSRFAPTRSLAIYTTTYTERGNCLRGLKRAAARAGRNPKDYEIVGTAPSLSFRLRPPCLIAAPTKAALKASAAAVPTNAHGMPAFLDQTVGLSREALDAQRAQLVAASKNREIKNPPASKLTNPKKKPAKSLDPMAKRKAATAPKSETSSKGGASRKPKAAKAASAPRATGSGKGAQLIAMLKARWTTMDELIAELGWLKHTTRAAISRLPTDLKDKLEHDRKDGVSRYRIA